MGKKILSIILSLLMMISFAANSTFAVFAEEVPLNITKQPEDVFGKLDETLFTTVEAKGEGLSYEWFVKDPSSTDFVKSALKSARYIFQMIEGKVGRQVYCVITDKYGNSVQSDIATFRASYLKIIKEPENMGGAEGESVSTSVIAEGEGLRYQWFEKDANSSEFTESSVTDSEYSVSLTSEISGRQVYCVLTDITGNCVRTKTVVIEITTPLTITKQPENTFGMVGANVFTTVEASGEGLSYQWFIKDEGSSEIVKSGITSARYIFTLTEEKSGRQVYCVITDKYGRSVQSETVTFRISNLKITKQPENMGGVNGETVSTSVTAEGESLRYQWFEKDINSSEFIESSIEDSTYSVSLTSEISGRQVYCVITDITGNCVRTKTVVIEITTPLTITKQPENTFGMVGVNVFTTVEASGEGLSYQWFIKDEGSSEIVKSGITSARYIFTLTEEKSGRQVYCVITDKYGRSVQSETVTFRISNLKITKQPPNAGGAIGKNVETTVIAEGEGLTYTWYVKDIGKASFSKSSITSNRYVFTMTAEKSGRQVYCVITDKYGNSVKSNIAVLGVDAALKIIEQPRDFDISAGLNATATVKAEGVGLRYTWYVKDMDNTEFVKSGITSNRYTYTMSIEKAGRQVYCVITDSSGCTVTSDTVTFGLAETLKIIKQPTDIGGAIGQSVSTTVKAEGEDLTYRWYFKDKGKTQFVRSTITSPTYKVDLDDISDGRQLYCLITDKFGSTVKTDVVVIGIYGYYISMDLGNGETMLGGASPEGEYTLKDPKRLGHTFVGWVDSEGNEFSKSGIIDKSVSIKAKWEIDGTDTLEKLLYLTNEGADTIKITGNITVDRPIYISYNTKIYSDGDYTILRAPNYSGDILVVGCDQIGVSAVMRHRKAVLTLGGGEGTLFIDGNRENLTGIVVGSAVYVGDSATLNLYDGVCIRNHKKLGNDRIFQCEEYVDRWAIERAGGAAILNINATVNMYGGVIENNEVCTEGVTETDETGASVFKEYNGCGGAFFNRGNFNMYGGIIRGNKALRGGGLYNDRIAKLESGSICENYAYTYGGAVASSSSSDADFFIGREGDGEDMLIKDNFSLRAGGAIYSSTTSPIIIYGSTVFEGNLSDSSGGAIYTAGTITAHNAVFRGNGAILSGGAIYHHYSNPEYSQRLITLTNCRFEANTSSLGGAVTLSGSEDTMALEKGVKVKVTDCIFTENSAIKGTSNPGNGGAIYVTRFADLTVTGCDFENNYANQSAGAVSIHSGAKVDLLDCNFTDNSARNGGAVYLAANVKASLRNLNFTGNAALLNDSGSAGHAGAVYMMSPPTAAENLVFKENSAEGNGGAVYLNGIALTLEADCSFEGNSADGHGGVAYLTYQNAEDNAKLGSVFTANGVIFKNNTASAGGAISVRSECTFVANNAQFIGNYATGTASDAAGGGAIYVGYGYLTLNNVTASGNISDGYGGAINVVGADLTVVGGTFENNNAISGGALNAIQDSTISVSGSKFVNNESTSENAEYNSSVGGGVINIKGGTLNVSKTTFDQNKTGYYGGAVLADGTTVVINENSIVKNSVGGTGSAFYFKGRCEVTIEDIVISDNIARGNGVIYASSGILDMTRVIVTGNKGGNGGVIYASGSTSVTVTGGEFSGNNATNGGIAYITGNVTLSLDGVSVAENTAPNGGAIYNYGAQVTLTDSVFSKNTTTGNGGAVYNNGGTVTANGDNRFTENTATNGHGGAVYVSYFTNEDGERVNGIANITDGSFHANSAMGGGAVSVRTGCEATFNGTVFTGNSVDGYSNENEGDGEGGGAIYVGFGSVTLENVTATGNTAYYGGAINAVTATVNIKGGNFSQNTASSGGAIYAQKKSTVEIDSANISLNESTDKTVEGKVGGGAINISEGTLTVSNTVLDGNKTGYYGGAVNSRGAVVTIDKNSVVKNSSGSTGAALYFRDGSKATLSDISVIGNTSKGNGVIYSNGGTLSVTNLTANDNSAYAGGVFFVSGGTATLDSVTASGNNATNGGVLQASGYAKVTVTGGSFTANSATSGGAAYVTGSSAKLTVNGCALFSGNTANKGGAIFLDLSAVVTVSDSRFESNSATAGNGGAIMIVDSSSEGESATKLTLNNTVFDSNTASSKGGAISTDTASPEIIIDAVGCTFSKNKALGAGGGAIEIQNGNCNSAEDPTEVKIVFKNCTFTQNTAKTTGAAVEIRTNSCAKFDSITATGNKASGVGGVIYVTSNYSRLYITGTVTQSGNTSSDSSFINLYTTSSYNCPPKIYTTHNSSAAWYSAVKGNKTSIVFNLTELP